MNAGEITFTVTVGGKLARSLVAVAFVTGKSIEAVAIGGMIGGEDCAAEIGELLGAAFCLMEDADDLDEMANRLREYRDVNGLDYPDYRIENNIAEFRGEIDGEEMYLLNQAGRILG